MRWLIRTLCIAHAEMRVVLRSLRAYYLRMQHLHTGYDEPDDQDLPWTFDRRITRSVRLSLLVGLLMVHIENPRLFAGAWIVLPLAILLALFQIAGSFR